MPDCPYGRTPRPLTGIGVQLGVDRALPAQSSPAIGVPCSR